MPGVTVTIRNQTQACSAIPSPDPTALTFISAVTRPARTKASFELQGFRKSTASEVALEVGKTATLTVSSPSARSRNR